MNKYLKYGILEIGVGLIALQIAFYLQNQRNIWYKPIMIFAVVIFAIGFITIVYRYIRRIDRSEILKNRRDSK